MSQLEEYDPPFVFLNNDPLVDIQVKNEVYRGFIERTD
jgi:hypothetical protein